jgi:hypothetical protein
MFISAGCSQRCCGLRLYRIPAGGGEKAFLPKVDEASRTAIREKIRTRYDLLGHLHDAEW